MAPDEETGVRLAELVAALSLPVDLGLGQPMEHVLRSTIVALRLAEAEDLDVDERAAAYYVSLLAWVVCVADTHEIGVWFGDEADYKEEVRITYFHELGHYLGLEEDDLEERGL